MSVDRRPAVARSASLLRRTAHAARTAFGRRDGRVAFGLASVGYFLLYAIGLRHLGLGPWAVELTVVEDPLSRAFRQVAPFQFEPVALVAVGPVEYLFAPVNAALGAGLALLVGVNLAVSLVAWRGPEACRIGAGAGVLAGVPGVLSGVACCGPAILLVVGVQASAGLIAAFQWFLPLAVLLLVGTLVWVGSRVNPV